MLTKEIRKQIKESGKKHWQILWEEDGFLLLYKVLTGYKYQWPRNASEVRMLTRMQYARLLEGLEIEKKVFSPPKEFF